MDDETYRLLAVDGDTGEPVEIVMTPAQVERLMIAAERGRLPDPDYVDDDEADDDE